jgi:hypothetical protein
VTRLEAALRLVRIGDPKGYQRLLDIIADALTEARAAT